MNTPKPGSIGWHDLTVPDAERVRDFYQRVAGWTAQPIDMGGYSDFAMGAPGADGAVAGICHARGTNAGLPPVWMVYIVVENLDAAIEEVGAAGGEVVSPAKSAGGGRFAVIRDPAGAVCALYQA